jgi:uncharacterized protein YerC
MAKKKIYITHQLEKTKHSFMVENPDSLTPEEVNRICQKMEVTSLLVNGRFYEDVRIDRQ